MKNIAKIFALMLALVLSASFVACSDEPGLTTDEELASVEDELEPDESEQIDAMLNPAGILPDNSVYYSYPNGEQTMLSADGVTEFPEPSNSDRFVYGDYVYTYNDGSLLGTAGWKAEVTEMKMGRTFLGNLLESVNGSPVVKVSFADCTSLASAPAIPASVKYMDKAFYNCFALQGEVEINATPETYEECFVNTAHPITITGACENKADLAATGVEGMITY